MLKSNAFYIVIQKWNLFINLDWSRQWNNPHFPVLFQYKSNSLTQPMSVVAPRLPCQLLPENQQLDFLLKHYDWSHNLAIKFIAPIPSQVNHKRSINLHLEHSTNHHGKVGQFQVKNTIHKHDFSHLIMKSVQPTHVSKFTSYINLSLQHHTSNWLIITDDKLVPCPNLKQDMAHLQSIAHQVQYNWRRSKTQHMFLRNLLWHRRFI